VTLLLLYLGYAILLSVALAQTGFRPEKRAPDGPTRSAPSRAPTVGAASRVLIVGATGGTGRQLVKQALERGFSVTAVVRDRSRMKMDHPQLRVIQGDVLDPGSMERAMQGQEAVLSALGHTPYFYPTRILSEGTRNILRAMETHRLTRLVCETSLGIGSSAGRLGLYYTFFVVPLILPFYFWDKTRQERAIAASSVEWVIVRPGTLNNRDARGRYRHGSNVGGLLGTVRVSRADVADFMLNQLTSDQYLRTAAGICW